VSTVATRDKGLQNQHPIDHEAILTDPAKAESPATEVTTQQSLKELQVSNVSKVGSNCKLIANGNEFPSTARGVGAKASESVCEKSHISSSSVAVPPKKRRFFSEQLESSSPALTQESLVCAKNVMCAASGSAANSLTNQTNTSQQPTIASESIGPPPTNGLLSLTDVQRPKPKPIPLPLPLSLSLTFPAKTSVPQSPAMASPRKTPLFKKAVDNNTGRYCMVQ
jgi:hypothetical protein